ncbi:MAG: amidohydrolase family protein [Eubacteriales bacterium]|nr:amidohydrolase family protein [Eubacteriales bacterium]
MLAVLHAALILPDRVLPDGMLLCREGKILYAGTPTAVPDGADILDAGGLYAGPGFVDVHCHGGGLWAAGEDPAGFARYHLLRGTTSVLATLGYGEEPEHRLALARRIREAMPACPSILGIHLEGPFKNPDFGFPGKYQTPVSVEYAERLFDACGGAARLMMVSPDAPGIEPILELTRARGIRLAAGHGNCTREQYALLRRYGLVDATHHYDASGDYREQSGVRKVGLDELVDLDDAVYAEIIPDHLGCHVAPERIRLCIRCKGLSRVIVITDAVPSVWNEDDEIDLSLARASDDPARPHSADDCDIHWVNGSLDGSELDMAKACFNMRRHTGLGVAEVWRMASENPARMLGVETRVGRLAPGADADLVLADGDFNVKKVVLKGRIVE